MDPDVDRIEEGLYGIASPRFLIPDAISVIVSLPWAGVNLTSCSRVSACWLTVLTSQSWVLIKAVPVVSLAQSIGPVIVGAADITDNV
jgi:hypothetical protein